MVFNMSEQEWDAVIAVHLKGTFKSNTNMIVINAIKQRFIFLNFFLLKNPNVITDTT